MKVKEFKKVLEGADDEAHVGVVIFSEELAKEEEDVAVSVLDISGIGQVPVEDDEEENLLILIVDTAK